MDQGLCPGAGVARRTVPWRPSGPRRRRADATAAGPRLMRILIIAHGFPPFAKGGAEIYAHAHATAFARGGDDVLVIAREADADRPEYAVRYSQQDDFGVAWINNTFGRVRSFEDGYRCERID